MADYSIVSPSEAFKYQFRAEAAQLRVALPGIIRSFDVTAQTVSAQPALRLKVNVGEGVNHIDLPVIDNVPIVLPFAQTAGLLLTLPIKPGDECLLVFADRAMDFFIIGGGMQHADTSAQEDTSSPRSHHLTDAVCIPGIVSNPCAVPRYNTEHIELRDRDRVNYISLGPTGITITDGAATWHMHGGKVTLNAPSGIEETSKAPVSRTTTSSQTILGTNIAIDGAGSGGAYEIDKTLKSRDGTFIDKDGVNLNDHTHNHGPEPDK